MTRASVVIPTHDHASTLPLTVRSILAQSVVDLEVLIVGDGVTSELRGVARDLEDEDSRVRFLDFEKGPHHGEVHRHTAITEARGADILYACDDDLLLPEHVADLCGLLESADFVQSRNGYVDPAGRLALYPGDLGDPRYIRMLLDETHPFNFVSLTGTGHTRAWYDAVGRPWATTPSGVWPDLHQWRRMLAADVTRPVRGGTSRQMTTLQFPTHLDGRGGWTPEERLDELVRWAAEIARPGAQERLDARVADAAWGALVDLVPRLADAERARENAEQARENAERARQAAERARDDADRAREDAERARDDAERARDDAERAREDAERAREAVVETVSWRVTAPLRSVRRLGRRAFRSPN